MGLFGKIFLRVSAVVLLLVGAAAAKSGVIPRDGEVIEGRPATDTEKSDILVEFMSTTNGPFTEQSVVSGIRRMFVTMSPDRMQQLSVFAREIRDLGLSPETEIKAVETLLNMIEQSSGSKISERGAAQLTGQIVDQFVTPGKLVQASIPAADSAVQGTDSPGSHPFDRTTQARSGWDHPNQEVQVAQAGILAPEKLELFRPILAPETLETSFGFGAGEITTTDAYHQ